MGLVGARLVGRPTPAGRLKSRQLGSAVGPRITLTGASVLENSATGTVVGTLGVVNATGTPVYSLDSNPGGYFAIDGDELKVDAAIDYETVQTVLITVSVADMTPTPNPREFVITIIDENETPDPGGGPSLDFTDPDNSQYIGGGIV